MADITITPTDSGIQVTRSINLDDIVAKMTSAGLKPYSERFGHGKVPRSIEARHNDRGQIEVKDANEIILLVCEPYYGCMFYKTVNSVDDGVNDAKDLLEAAHLPIGTQVFVCQDVKLIRKTFSD